MTRMLWRTEIEAAREAIAAGKIVALAYIAWQDADCFVVCDDEDELEKFKKDTFTSIYSGWITRDFSI